MHRAETIRHHKHKQISHTITPSYHHTNLTIRQETYNPQCLCVRGIHTLLLDYFFTMRKIPWYFNVCLLLQYKPQSDQEKNANNKLSFLTTGLCLPTVTTVNVIFFFPLCLWLDLTLFSLEFCKNSKPAVSSERNETETPLWAGCQLSVILQFIISSKPQFIILTCEHWTNQSPILTGGVCCFLLIVGFINDHRQFRQYWGLYTGFLVGSGWCGGAGNVIMTGNLEH